MQFGQFLCPALWTECPREKRLLMECLAHKLRVLFLRHFCRTMFCPCASLRVPSRPGLHFFTLWWGMRWSSWEPGQGEHLTTSPSHPHWALTAAPWRIQLGTSHLGFAFG